MLEFLTHDLGLPTVNVSARYLEMIRLHSESAFKAKTTINASGQFAWAYSEPSISSNRWL